MCSLSRITIELEIYQMLLCWRIVYVWSQPGSNAYKIGSQPIEWFVKALQRGIFSEILHASPFYRNLSPPERQVVR